MATVVFVRDGQEDVRVDVPARERLLDVCDACAPSAAPIPFSCRGATCGSCRVLVLEGADRLEPPVPAEARTLAILASPPTCRLGCQAVVRGGPGVVRLRPCGVAPSQPPAPLR